MFSSRFWVALLLFCAIGISCNRKSGCPANQALLNQQMAIESGSYKPSKPSSGVLPTDGKDQKYKKKKKKKYKH